MNKIDLLDHGFVRLVDHMGSDLSISRNARVSYDAEWRTDEVHPDAELFRQLMRENNEVTFTKYKQMIADGCPRELARSILPVSTYSHMFATMNLNNLFKFLAERLHPHAQYEIRVYAEAMLELIKDVAPVAVAAFKKRYEKQGY